MNVGVLYTGGKDSHLSLLLIKDYFDVSCLITLRSENEYSYMFHTPCIDIVDIHSKLMRIPVCYGNTKGEKEKELIDLLETILKAKKEYNLNGIVTGANRSIYQNTRIQKICKKLNLWCFNPLWLSPEEDILKLLIKYKVRAIISSVSSFPFKEDDLGMEMCEKYIKKLKIWSEKYKISLIGEGGEFETMVVDSPLFKKRIIPVYEKYYENYSGKIIIKNIILEDKK